MIDCAGCVSVVLTVVYSEPEPDEELVAYKRDLEGAGAMVRLVPRAQGVKCVLEAQLIRMLAYLYPEVIYTGRQSIGIKRACTAIWAQRVFELAYSNFQPKCCKFPIRKSWTLGLGSGPGSGVPEIYKGLVFPR